MKKNISINRKKTVTIEPNFEEQLMNDEQFITESHVQADGSIENDNGDGTIDPPVEQPSDDASAELPAEPAKASSRKLSNEKALDILQRLDQGVKGSVLAKEYNVDSSTISDIKVGRLYKTVLAEYQKSKATA